MATFSKRIRPVLKQARALDCTVERTNGGHVRITCPDGGVIFTGMTPSDPRSVKNLTAMLRRKGVELPR